MAPSSDDSKRLQPPSGISRTLEQKPATIPVQAASGVLGNIGDNAVTGRAESIRYSTDEEMIWQESPSLALLVPRLIKYAILMAIVLIACAVGRGVVGSNPAAQAALERGGIRATAEGRSAGPARRLGHKPRSGHRAAEAAADGNSSDGTSEAVPETPRSEPGNEAGLGLDRILLLIKLGFGGLFTLLLLLYLLKLKTTKYCASSQRLIVEEGSWHSENRPYELHRLGDAVIQRPLLLRMMGVSNLVIIAPHIELYGLRNADYVRDILRQGGQLEAQRVDKIRWR